MAMVMQKTAEREMPEGYKKTDVGMIPEGWEVDDIGSFRPFVTSGSRGWADYYSEAGSLFVRITNLRRNSIYLDLSNRKHVSLPVNSAEAERTELQTGDVLISITADIGISGYVDESVPKPAYINQHIALVRFGKNVNSKFVSYYLAGENIQRLFASRTDQGAKAGINLASIRAIKLAWPSTAEQTAIANALSDVDALIAGQEKLITKKQAIKTATMQQLLTGKIRLPQFAHYPDDSAGSYKKTELGFIPSGWGIFPLGDLLNGKPKYGINAAAVPLSNGLPVYIRITDISEDGRFSPETKVGVNSPFSDLYQLAEGDLVLARTGASVGKSYLYRKEDGMLVYAGFLIKISPGQSKLDPRFLFQFLQTDQYWSWVAVHSMRSGQPGINGNEYGSLPVICPPLAEQTAIATILTDIDSEIEALQQRLTKTRQIKQGMMQELLTGKTRLPFTDTAA